MHRDTYKALFERSADAILIIDNQVFTDCNAAALSLLGFQNKKDIVGKHPAELSPIKQPDGTLSLDKANEIMALAHSRGNMRFEWNHCRGDGFPLQLEVLLTAIPGGGHDKLHVVWREISERKKTEHNLQENLQLLHSIIENQPTCVKLVRKDGTLLDMNPAGMAMAAAPTRDSIIGKSVYNLIDDDDLPAYREYNERVCEGIKATMRYALKGLDGSRRIVESIAVPFRYGDKNEVVQLGITRDITAHLEMEQEKDRLEKLLNQAQKMEAIGTLAGGIAHDFNNILAAIIGYTELAKLKIAEASAPSDIDHDLSQVLQACSRARELSKQILTFSRQTEHELKPTMLDVIAKEVVKLLRASIPATIDIRENIQQGEGAVMADAGQIHQVFMNLCTNAYHAMRETGGIMTLELFHVDIDSDNEKVMSLQLAPGPHALIRISDTGHGISPSVMEKIFDPYFSTKKKTEGTGLGLSVVHGIVKSHHGHICVYSEPKRGSTFSIYLPKISSASTIPDAQKTVLYRGTESILLIDDELPIIDAVQAMLENLGYRVQATTNCKEALAMFRAKSDTIDLVITDMTMPQMTGVSLAKQILTIKPDIPIILCSGFSDLINEEKAKAIGIREYVMKPVVFKELSEVVRKALHRT